MVDVVDAKTRSRMMAAIKGANTKPELLVRRYLHATGLRFRLHDRRLPGTPDLILSAHRAAIFVHGCFWHRHTDCHYATTPATRPDFWAKKFASNKARDRSACTALRDSGWRVFTIWECETPDELALDRLFWWIVAPPDAA
ncbi:MAG: DNA mismatch endonuclease Vsr [Burkholderiales bacterium]|nr:MAG: DNA mismatch endonuclease Vsr [Burkholderiales bacterium]